MRIVPRIKAKYEEGMGSNSKLIDGGGGGRHNHIKTLEIGFTWKNLTRTLTLVPSTF